MKIGMVTKNMFFNSPAVMSAVDKATRANLSKSGAFIRQRAKSSIRSRKRPSVPGQPPSSHTKDLKRRILFSYDKAARDVIIGPTLLNKVYFDDNMRPTRGTVPELLEKGGSMWVAEEFIYGRWRRIDLRRTGAGARVQFIRDNPTERGRVRKRKVTIQPRPYMGPALENSKPEINSIWANSIK